MRYCINLLLWTTFVDEEHFPLLQELKDAGYDGVEVPVVAGDPEHYAKIGAELDRIGLARTAVTALYEAHNPVSPDPAMRKAAVEELNRCTDKAKALGSDVLCGPFHSAYKEFTGAGPTDDELGWCADVMRECATHAQSAGVTLMVEALNRFECYVLNTAGQARELVERVDHPAFRSLYDTHHMHIEENDIAAAIAASAEVIGHVHISENQRGVPGSGQVNWTATFEGLKKIGYDGWLVIEAFSRLDPEFAAAIHIWRDFFSSPEEVYRDGLAFMKRMWDGA